ncbi:MAG: hypothetical protein COW01_06325 [Bdellovibrionales bacterium CG12_big_fil_rev_8_21_14_0_65_38_15]|nr:MAG: hypothetical protein COW01_06325 [Bdellovibrionales bacterium CG12_big_fil_rev_8_21_14_0_65_38_15]
MKRNQMSLIFFSLMTVLFLLDSDAVTSMTPGLTEVKYRTSFGSCPSRAVGKMTLQLVKAFEDSGSLRSLKEMIVKEKLDQRSFISSYSVSYDPLRKYLNFKYECPNPLMKVQIYKNNGLESYEAILVDNGELYDPTYEVLLKTDKKLSGELPFLALPVGNMDDDVQRQITKIVAGMDTAFRKKLSEVILNESGELTVILSVKGHPSSVFLGKDEWNDKVIKLGRLVTYMESKNKIPAIINLTNSKKVVVKFNDRF